MISLFNGLHSLLPSLSGNGTAAAGVAMGNGNERIASKHEAYFDLAEAKIAKAAITEEHAISQYRKAQTVLAEGMSISVPSDITSCELGKVKSYRQKMSECQGKVSDRLQTLSRRTGCTSTMKNSASPLQTRVGAPTATNGGKSAAHKKASCTRTTASVSNNHFNNARSSRNSTEPESAYDVQLVEMINSVIVDKSKSVKWKDIAGLGRAKRAMFEMVILPTIREDLFTGLRQPPKGLLLFGPPGTGKTMLAKAVASESNATFFNVSPSSLTSKWVGEGEKLVRTLFSVAISRQQSVIFMDEIDSILSTRTSNENEASRRMKSEFLVQFDGVASNSNDHVIVIGATNKPQELDDAVLRRLVKRIYIPLPDANVRRRFLEHQLKEASFSLPCGDLERLAKMTEGYTGSDLRSLCTEAAWMPIRELGPKVRNVPKGKVRPLKYEDFVKALDIIRPSLQKSKWVELEKWNWDFGTN